MQALEGAIMAKRVSRRTGSVRSPGTRKLAKRTAALPRRPAGRRAKAPAVAIGQPISNGVGMRLQPIPAGNFTMGSPKSEKGRNADEQAVKVTISRPFFLAATVVTQGQWRKVMGTEPWRGERSVERGTDHPAVYVDWNAAVAFCKALTAAERKAGRVAAGAEYRLPTEAEWEYACRAGTTTAYSFGASPRRLGEFAWFYGNTEAARQHYAHPVGTKKPNPWGLYDMHGNTYEWCADWYAPKLAGGTDPAGPAKGLSRVLRGGGWGYDPPRCRSADRNKNDPTFSDFSGGFRVVLTVP
jgi:formylglycine-generating enzyme required for sulfatase activity